MSGFTKPTLEDLGFVALSKKGQDTLWIKPEAIIGIQPAEQGGSHLFLQGFYHNESSKVFVEAAPETIAQALAVVENQPFGSHEPTE